MTQKHLFQKTLEVYSGDTSSSTFCRADTEERQLRALRKVSETPLSALPLKRDASHPQLSGPVSVLGFSDDIRNICATVIGSHPPVRASSEHLNGS